jgi:hypothetical protein
MDSWEGRWRRAGEMLVTLGVGSGFIWSATILASPDAKVSIAPALIVCAFLAAMGTYCWIAPSVERLPLPGRQAAAIAQRRSHPGFGGHVGDQRNFAQSRLDMLFRQQDPGRGRPINSPLSLAGPAGRDFRAHFPSEADLIDRWDEALAASWEANGNYSKFVGDECERITASPGPSLPTLLASLANHQVSMDSFTWEADGGRVILLGWNGGRYDIGPAIADPETAAAFLARAWTTLSTIASADLAIEADGRAKTVADLRTQVTDALESVTRTHDLTGRCDHCP